MTQAGRTMSFARESPPQIANGQTGSFDWQRLSPFIKNSRLHSRPHGRGGILRARVREMLSRGEGGGRAEVGIYFLVGKPAGTATSSGFYLSF